MNWKASERIALRGKLDSLNAIIIMLQSESNNEKFIADLEEIRIIVNKIQRCEAMNKNFSDRVTLFGLDAEELHERSHNPSGGHIMPHYEMGRNAAALNVLRTLVREAELCAVKVFGDDDNLNICHVLNRLSSAVYVLIYDYLPEGYDRVIYFKK